MAYRGSGRFPGDCAPILLCKWLGWSYDELMDAPDWIVEDAMLMMSVEGAVSAERSRSKPRATAK